MFIIEVCGNFLDKTRRRFSILFNFQRVDYVPRQTICSELKFVATCWIKRGVDLLFYVDNFQRIKRGVLRPTLDNMSQIEVCGNLLDQTQHIFISLYIFQRVVRVPRRTTSTESKFVASSWIKHCVDLFI